MTSCQPAPRPAARTASRAGPPGSASQVVLSGAAAAAWVPRTCFKHGPPGRVGVELEFLVRVAGRPAAPTDGPAYDAWRAAAVALPARGQVTIEPGGQVELSTAPAPSLVACLASAAADLAALRALAAAHGLVLVGAGVDDREVDRRVRREPRYDAMEGYLDRWGPAGRTMMRRTASVQVNLEAATEPDAGQPGQPGQPGEPVSRAADRWRVLHVLGPVLVAAFANSPAAAGPWAGWASSRLGVWLALDPARTAEPVRALGESLEQAFTRWCLDAPLLLARRSGPDWSPPEGVSFRDWIAAGEAVVPGRAGPDVGDLEYHLTTVFPPVRPRGHLEVRYLDAQPGDWWQVPVSVLWALTEDAAAAALAEAAAAPHRGRWEAAARHGLRDPELARAAVAVLRCAAQALRRRPEAAAAAAGMDAYLRHWTARGRCPGDDLREGRPVPAAPMLQAPPVQAPPVQAPTARREPAC